MMPFWWNVAWATAELLFVGVSFANCLVDRYDRGAYLVALAVFLELVRVGG